MAQPIQVTTLQLIKMAMLSRGIFIVGQKANPKDPISKGWPTQWSLIMPMRSYSVDAILARKVVMDHSINSQEFSKNSFSESMAILVIIEQILDAFLG